jgi:hypothetical protein
VFIDVRESTRIACVRESTRIACVRELLRLIAARFGEPNAVSYRAGRRQREVDGGTHSTSNEGRIYTYVLITHVCTLNEEHITTFFLLIFL